MIGKFILIGLFFFAAAQENRFRPSIEALKKAVVDGRTKIEETNDSINRAETSYDEVAQDRKDRVIALYENLKNAVDRSSEEAVFKGLIKKKQFASFQCVSDATQETFEKLEVLRAQIPEAFQSAKNKKLLKVYAYRMVVAGLSAYIEDLNRTKFEEIMKIERDEDLKKVVKEVEGKINHLVEIVNQISLRVRASKFEFFEDFVDKVFKIETNLSKTQREGSFKIMLCVF